MTRTAFDAGGYLRFNLSEGAIESDDNRNLALLPLELLSTMSAGQETADAARTLGAVRGKSLADNLEPQASLEDLAQHLGTSLAVLGLGRTKIRIHGDALMFEINGPGVNESPLARILTGFIEGYADALYAKRDFRAVHMGAANEGALIWVGNPQAAARLKREIDAGAEPTAALSKIGQGGAQ